MSATDALTFSVDTLKMDTIISGEATSTYTFQIYNRAKLPQRLTRVALEGGGASPFRVNVDGVFLEDGIAEGLEVGAEDSLRVFLMARIPATDDIEPRELKDRLIFTTEAGRNDGVVITAMAQNVKTLRGHTITTDTTWTGSNLPMRIMDSLVIAPGATLTLEAGTKILFHAGAGMTVCGRLITKGTTTHPVVMRSDRLGYMFSNQPYDRIPGGWGGITIATGSYENHLNGVDIHGGSFGLRIDSTDIFRESLLLENSIIHCVTGYGLDVRNARLRVGNTEVSNAGADCVRLMGGDATFIHCTIASFYPFEGQRGVALRYTNADEDVRLPLIAAHFTNCIITGWSSDEIMGERSERYPDDAFGYRFDHCLLGTPAIENDEAVTDCLWDDDYQETKREKNFTPSFDAERLIYLFYLSPKSPACGTARPDITTQYYPLDRLGRDRMANGRKPDMGCYRAEEAEEE